MTDEQTQEGETQETTKEDTGTGDKSEATNVVEAARETAERLEKANTEGAAILKQQQELAARELLGGKTAGAEQEEKKELSNADYMKEVLAGKHNG